MQNTRVVLLRHGACEGGNILRGHTDVMLNLAGKEQLNRAISRLLTSKTGVAAQNKIADLVVSSPLLRCALPAKIFAQQYGIDFIEQAAFMELNFGDWDGQSFSALYQQYSSELDAYWANPWQHTPPNGETMQVFEARIDTAWRSLVELHQGKVIVLVTHGGVIRHLMAKSLQLKQCAGIYSALKLPYAATVVIDVLHDGEQQHLSLNWGLE
ncbi:histidine phosphatase family protein [Shewanella sp. Choline-02u-19]|uniref:histidine phosphatase family protein n=1 Tax=unclassified Shewanella TaxID=196818 RepID=UPI000C327C1A|nr:MULTISPECIES: histidine phosphatase family protein [unclassified Shewanella]PKG57004.1 histidine phosphatase family protein [Shewanella sp. GutDb-MelDb]PKH54564.1 histidine phosphatase family protein [Shewanella sp. Bg11-22]PKI28622.1 histidine phosphatase family protein [Shewanella sp. Choline-02u-19]